MKIFHTEENTFTFASYSDETIDSFNAIVRDLWPLLDVHHGRQYKLNIPNRVLMLFIWLKAYPTLYLLSVMFDVCETSISQDIRSMLPLFWNYTHNVIRWPTLNEWRSMHGVFEMFPTCAGMIDGTVHEVQRPRNDEQQGNLYDGHHRYHCLSTQIVCDTKKNIRYVHTGFDGSLNDAGQFLRLPSIGYGPNDLLQFPAEMYLLADKGYANRYPLITPFRVNQMVGNPQQIQAMRMYNTEHAAHRIYIEHIMRHMKTYRSVALIFRHSLQQMPLVADICAFLAQRNIALENAIH